MNKNSQFNTPILFRIFNRPHTTEKVFMEIKKIKPRQLFIASDGPRDNNNEDIEKNIKAKKIAENVDWDCKITKLYSDKNLGGPIAGRKAINWFFENVEEGIILEDDCLPNQSFFWYCDELLEKYRDNEKIFCINGSNFQSGKKRGKASYYFSVFPHSWGWATWRRAWKYWGKNIEKNYQKIIENQTIEKLFKNEQVQNFWLNKFKGINDGKINNWDYIWLFTCWHNNALACTPNSNLITNIGHGKDAQHTNNKKDKRLNRPNKNICFPIIHPIKIEQNTMADIYTSNIVYKIDTRPVIAKIIIKIVKYLLK